jgi:ATP phosphoribosyltransferase regulatory subunit
VSGLGAALVGGGRYDQMLARFGYDCPATGFAFEVGRAMLALESQGARPELAGPDFYIIDFTADKTQALAIARRYRDLGAAVARDIISRALDDSLAYARQQRARWVLVIGEPGRRADEVRVLDLRTSEQGGQGSAERVVSAGALLGEPAKYFSDLKEGGHA